MSRTQKIQPLSYQPSLFSLLHLTSSPWRAAPSTIHCNNEKAAWQRQKAKGQSTINIEKQKVKEEEWKEVGETTKPPFSRG